MTCGICVLTWVLCYVTLSWGASLTPVLQVSRGQLSAIASLGATLMMARSPASAVRLGWQNRREGGGTGGWGEVRGGKM